ncbi:MAG: hypothetical protein ABIJ61_03710, partial [bacterium]
IMSTPLIAHRYQGEILNRDALERGFEQVVSRTGIVTAGRLMMFRNGGFPGTTRYNPVGYILRNAEQDENKLLLARDAKVRERHARLESDARQRLAAEETANA